MDEELKRKAYLEGMKLMKAGYDQETIRARLDKLGIPEALIRQVLTNLFIQQKANRVAEQKPFFNIALLRVGIGVFLAIVSYLLVPGEFFLPIGLIVGGIVAAFVSKSKVK
jgi:VIT1/CCC1 family predicted Fe2+/Mn2+ transporter